MAILIVLLFGFIAASAYAYQRWRLRGLAVLCVALVVVEAARGTVEWMRPHADPGGPRPWDWACHSTVALTPVAILGLGVALSLHLTRHRATSFEERLVISGFVCALLTIPAIVGILWWSVVVLACDTL